MTGRQKDSHVYDVVILGAGMSGIGLGVELLRNNVSDNFLIVDRNKDVGGIWQTGRFPGAYADAQSPLYSFSYPPIMQCNGLYADGDELLMYLKQVCEYWRLGSHLCLDTEVESVDWDCCSMMWQVCATSHGLPTERRSVSLHAAYFVSAIGQLGQPSIPEIPGLRSFAGEVIHSSQWSRRQREPDGMKVALIGTGATAASLAPELAELCPKLVVFQRSAPYVLPRDNVEFSHVWKICRWLLPFLHWTYRRQMLETQDQAHAVVVNEHIRQHVATICAQYLSVSLPGSRNSSLRDKLQPRYTLGCKRIVLSSRFLPLFTRDSVCLETRPIDKIAPGSILISPGNSSTEDNYDASSSEATEPSEYEVDMIILATGFHAQRFLSGVKISLGGADDDQSTLEHIWAHNGGPRAYKGVSIQSLPNFAMLLGPNSNLSHISLVLVIEAQASYIGRHIREVVRKREQGLLASIRIDTQAIQRYNLDLQDRLRTSAFADSSCSSWYKDHTGSVTNNWPGTAMEYMKMMSHIEWSDYHIEAKLQTRLG